MTWERIERSGEITVKLSQRPGYVDVGFITAPTDRQDEWVEYFEEKAVELRMHVEYDDSLPEGDHGILRAPTDTFEASVEHLDQALEYANDEYEKNVLPGIQAKERGEAAARDAADQQQAALDARAAKLAKPVREL